MKRSGFTLVEILVALAILSVVFTLLYLTFHQSMAAMADMEERGEVIQRGRMILERMGSELGGTFLPSGDKRSPAFQYGLIGQSGREGDPFRDRLDFTSYQSELRQAGWTMSEIGYFLDHEPGARGLSLFRRQDDALDGDLLKGGQARVVCDRVRSLNFLFFTLAGGKEKEWNTLQGAHRGELPARIEIDLGLEDDKGRIHFFQTQVYLPLGGEK